MSHRLAQIESTLKRAIGLILAQKLSDPRITGMISVTHVKVSPDLHEAYVYVTVLPSKHQTRTIYGLQHASVHIHAKVSQMVDLKRIPHLDFRSDESLKKQAGLDAAIHKGIQRERKPRSGDSASSARGSKSATNRSSQTGEAPTP